MSDYLVFVLTNMGMIAFVGLSAYLLLMVGQVSFGQQAFFAIGAYAGGIATAMWGWPLAAGLVWGALVAGGAGTLIGVPTLRTRGLAFSVATLVFAEMTRLFFEIFTYRLDRGGELVGPNGSEGFRDIRYVYDRDISSLQYLGIVAGLLLLVMAGFALLERARLGSVFRMLGQDEVVAELMGIHLARYKLLASALGAALAGLGGGLYAHLATYVEPKIFTVMLGVHSLAYGLIGGLGTAWGPLIGVAIDIGLLESMRGLAEYRMIVFGGLVALLLVFRPRGLLDEAAVHAIRAAWDRARGRMPVAARR